MKKEEFPYKSCYCEENIYKFLEILKNDSFYAVLISNKNQQIPLWKQKSNRDFVVWDYHVIAIGNGNVYDFDTILDWPQDFETYFNETMNIDIDLDEEYRRKFRIIQSTVYLEIFSSDRSHMKNEDNSWKMPPPNWPIINKEKTSKLMDLIDMQMIIEKTKIMDEKSFYDFFIDKK